jgi:hypothetical protein
MTMRSHTLLMPLLAFACASISGKQTFETTQQFTLPNVGAFDASARAIAAVSEAGEFSFAESVLDEVDALRELDYIDSAQATVRIVSLRLSTDTSFAGVSAVRVQLIAGTETIELCNRTLTAEDQESPAISCDADHVMNEATLQNATTTAGARLGAQLMVSGAVTATRLSSVVTFDVEVDIDASL